MKNFTYSESDDGIVKPKLTLKLSGSTYFFYFQENSNLFL